MWENIYLKLEQGSFRFLPHGEDLTIFCNDREIDLIEGICHELVDASVYELIQRQGFDPYRSFVITSTEQVCLISHLVAVFSLPFYSMTEKSREMYESFFKERRKDRDRNG